MVSSEFTDKEAGELGSVREAGWLKEDGGLAVAVDVWLRHSAQRRTSSGGGEGEGELRMLSLPENEPRE